jgi:4-hydroxy-2-oxoglutarate aldolase
MLETNQATEMIDLKGIYPPIPTSFDEKGNLALESMQRNLETLAVYDLAGFLVLGSNGETVMLSETEKLSVFKAARKAIPGNRLMLAGTGGQSTRETILLTRGAADAGADAAVVLNPFYYKGLMTKAALVRHFHQVADQSSIPLIIYNMPANTGLDMSADTILAIAGHPNIIGLKDSGGDLVKMGDITGHAKPGFQVLAGSAGFLLPALSLGAVGGILALANIAPRECIGIYQDFVAGNHDKARLQQIRMIRLNAMVTREKGVPALKSAMDMTGLYGGPCREPILPLDAASIDQLSALVREIL